MTSCDEIRMLLALQPEDRSITEERRVRAHLDVCSECANRVEAYAEQDRVIRSAPRLALTPSQRDQLLSAIERKRRRQMMRSRLFSFVGATASVVAVVGLILVSRFLLPWDVHLVPRGPGASPSREAPEDHADDIARGPLDSREEGATTSEAVFQWPTIRREISGWAFHDPHNPEHPGIDISAARGDPVYSVGDGEVSEAGWRDGERGYTVVVEHGAGWSSTYAQLEEVAVDTGQIVNEGELVGRAGSTGNSSGPHLHFELHHRGRAVNPMDHLPLEPDLRDLLLQEEEVPGTGPDGGDWEPEIIYPSADDWITRLSQAEGCREAWKVEGFRQVEGGAGGVYVWNGVYGFETAQEAKAQYEALLEQDVSSGEMLYGGGVEGGMEATAIAFSGSEGETIYWLFGIEGKQLHLLMVDGVNDDAGGFFETAMTRVLER